MFVKVSTQARACLKFRDHGASVLSWDKPYEIQRNSGTEQSIERVMIQISELQRNKTVSGKILVAEKHLSRTKEGKPFLRLSLMNPSGRIEGILWENAEQLSQRISQGQVVEIRGVVTFYQQEKQIKLQEITPVPKEQGNPDSFLPSSARKTEEMQEELHRVIRTIKNPFLRRLLEDIFRDPDIWKAFCRAPAAKSMHHAYLGGLLEHTLSLALLVRVVLKHYPFLDGDLVLAGALLHDLGKTWELSPDLGFDYTDEGRLLGHILMGLDVMEKKIACIPEFPQPLAMQLKHVVASHHGELEFGSPKQPMTLEAICLHMLDNLDAKLLSIHEYMNREAVQDDRWTPFHRVLQRFFYVPESFSPQASGKDRKKGSDPTDPELFLDPKKP